MLRVLLTRTLKGFTLIVTLVTLYAHMGMMITTTFADWIKLADFVCFIWVFTGFSCVWLKIMLLVNIYRPIARTLENNQ